MKHLLHIPNVMLMLINKRNITLKKLLYYNKEVKHYSNDLKTGFIIYTQNILMFHLREMRAGHVYMRFTQ